MGKRIKEMEEILRANADDYIAVDGDHSEARKITVLHLLGSTDSGVSSFNDRTGAVFPENGDYTPDMVGIVGAISDVTINNLPENLVVITSSNGKIVTSGITAAELQSLSGIKSNIQYQLDCIPKYEYLPGLEISVSDDIYGSQTEIDIDAIQAIQEAYPTPLLWNVVVVRVNFIPSDNFRDAQYLYNGTEWLFQYYVSTGINRADGNTAGIVENSDDVEFTDGKATVVHSVNANEAGHSEKADNITGADVAGNFKYYGTDGDGNVGFHAFEKTTFRKEFSIDDWTTVAPYVLTIPDTVHNLGSSIDHNLYISDEDSWVSATGYPSFGIRVKINRTTGFVRIESTEKFNGLIILNRVKE